MTTGITTTDHDIPLPLGQWQRNLAGLQQRRLRAARLLKQGVIQAEVARTLEVSPQAVSVWHARWRAGGAVALVGAGREGRRPRLSAEQRKTVGQALRQGARAHGFNTDGWTLKWIAQVIEQLTGVRHHPGHVWKLLRSMGGACSARSGEPASVMRTPSGSGGQGLAADPGKRPAAQGSCGLFR